MSERDRHFLTQYSTYHRADVVARVEEYNGSKITTKKAQSVISIALNHLMTPNNVATITGVSMFVHSGKYLTNSPHFSTRTLKALKKQNILTTSDLETWVGLGAPFLFRIPGVGKAGVIEILTWYFEWTKQK
jgi:hypothetical protein